MNVHVRCRYDIVDCVVLGHGPYGLLIESEDGERGFVDSSYITDTPGEPWPEKGQRLRYPTADPFSLPFCSTSALRWRHGCGPRPFRARSTY
jgi:hypothetical protein